MKKQARELGNLEDHKGKKPFEEPKLTYVKPELKEQGKVEDITLAGFFGSFSP